MRGIDASVPNSARIWNYWMGGKDHYPVDQAAGDAYVALAPQIEDMAWESRRFLIRVVTHLAQECGVRQFLDVGTGLPTYENTHEVAQGIDPTSKIVYVDNDPIVLVHARTLLRGTKEGVTAYVNADLREPEDILAAAGKVLDLTQPVALLLMGILGHIEDYQEATTIVRRLLTALPHGSYFAHYDGTFTTEGLLTAQRNYDATGAVPYVLRTPQKIAAFYDGLTLLAPGIVSCPLWRPDPGTSPAPTDIYGGVARKE
ncbi:SAM-dependent methyltransferase [Streptomyces sp. NPDC048420]|uniref:SAM-dependent methyltransferase n=1 Tax=Streptomyces sp. NPDC048420 TaxID=3155755 RepID=UPI003413E1FC